MEQTLKSYESSLKTYLQSQTTFFNLSEKFDAQKVKFMGMTLTMGSSNDKKALKKYKKQEESFAKLQGDLKIAGQNYESETEKFDQQQWQYFGNLSNTQHQFSQTCLTTFSQVQDNVAEFMNSSSVCYKVPYNAETFQNLKNSLSKNQFQFGELVPPTPERRINYVCYQYFTELLARNENAIVQEILKFQLYCKDVSKLTFFVRSLYDRDIDVNGYLQSINTIGGAMSPGIRYLYMMLLTFEDLKFTKEPSKIGRILMKSITDNLRTIQEDTGDKQFIYYILKVGDLMYYKDVKRVSMMGIVHSKFPVMEKYRFKKRKKDVQRGDLKVGENGEEIQEEDDKHSTSEYSVSQFSKLSDQNKNGGVDLQESFQTGQFLQKIGRGVKKLVLSKEMATLAYIQTPEFWGTYYRHNNYFYVNNTTIFSQFRNQGAEKGMELLLKNGNKSNLNKDLAKKVLNKHDMLSGWGIRACSLNDIIRFMIFLNFDIQLIQKICFEVSQTYKMDKKLAYRVFRQTEDEFSIRNYVRMDTNESVDKQSHWFNISMYPKLEKLKSSQEAQSRLCEVLKLVVDFLTPKEALEVCLTSKYNFEKVKKPVLENLLRNYELKQDDRVQAWLSYMPEVRSSPFQQVLISFRHTEQRK